MSGYRLLPDAAAQVDEIFDYTYARWGEAQAIHYFEGLRDKFGAIVARSVIWRRIPATYEVDGYYCLYEHHLIYWKVLEEDVVGIVAVLHERMSQSPRVREAFND